MKDLEAKLRLKARNELVKWLHKPHEEPELSDFEQGFLEAAKLAVELVDVIEDAARFNGRDDCNGIAGEICANGLEEFNLELES